MSNGRGDQAFRSSGPYGREPEMTYGGALSFLRRQYTRTLTGADVVVSGLPFDSATSNRPGARFGPRAIRAASTQLAELLAYPWGFDPFETLAVIDWGDCYIDYGYSSEVMEAIAAHADSILASGARMLTFGGDHFVTYPLLKAHAKRHGPMALIHFDAHPDTWPDDGRRLDHGTMFTRAVDEGLVDVNHSVQVGIRTCSEPIGFTVLDAAWVHSNGPAQAVAEIHRAVGSSPAYITFDIDCLDPAYAPGTGTPVVGGLSSSQALAILRGLGDLNLIGMDLVEVAPAYDHAEITALAAATLAHDFLCLLAWAKRSQSEGFDTD